MKKTKYQLFVLILVSILLLAACGKEDVSELVPTETTADIEAAPEIDPDTPYTEPEAPPMTFETDETEAADQADVSDQTEKVEKADHADKTENAEQPEEVPTEEQPDGSDGQSETPEDSDETAPSEDAWDENELPAIPF